MYDFRVIIIMFVCFNFWFVYLTLLIDHMQYGESQNFASVELCVSEKKKMF